MQFEYRRLIEKDYLLHTLDLESKVLQNNPLGDPCLRSHPVLRPLEGYSGLPIVLMLSGYTSFNHKVVNKSSLWHPTVAERLARALARGDIAPAVFVWPSCETKLGGSQYVNSIGSGQYEDYIMKEIIPCVEQRFDCGGEGKRFVVGKSSGGFGALSLVMRNPGFFTGAASHAGDMGFDMSHFRGFADALTCWLKYGGIQSFLEKLPTLTHFGAQEHAGIEAIAMATIYSPNPSSELGFDLPVDPDSGEINHDVFSRWLEFDPLRMVDQEEYANGLRQLSYLYLDAGEEDEFALQWGLKRISKKFASLKIEAHIEYFPGGHFVMDDRWERSLSLMLPC